MRLLVVSTESTTGSSTGSTPGTATSSRHRPDIQGLRAIAVLAVVALHVGFGSLTGGFVGVDVFFAISGFLITQQLIRQVRTEGRVSLLGFYARRARRILPAATLVLLATVVYAALFLGFVRTRVIALDALWSAAFAANFRFASLETDYFSAALPPSPLQHFWSLAVEEQFYLVWPLVILGCVWAIRKRRQAAETTSGSPEGLDRLDLRRRRALVIALGVVIVASLLASAVLTRTSPEAAYFSPFTRGWELGLGAIAAIAFRDDGPQDATARWRAQILSAFGMFFIVCACLQFNDATPFPGTPALVPVLGSVFIIVAGTLWHGPTVVGRLLSVKPLQVVGNWSYSLYLWHFPVLVLAELQLGRELRWWEQVLLVALAFALAGLSYHFVEEPFRRGVMWRRPLLSRAGALGPVALYPLSITLVAVTCFGANTYATGTARDGYQPAITLAEADSSDQPERPAASSAPPAAKVEEPPDPLPALLKASVLAARKNQPIPTNLEPGLTHLSDDVETVGECNYYSTNVRKLCPRGDTDSEKTIVVIGDSHARHWTPAVEEIAERAGYRAYMLAMPQCTVSLVTPDKIDSTDPMTSCDDFHDFMLASVKKLRPDLLLISSRPIGAAYHDSSGRHTDRQVVRRGVYRGYERLLAHVKPVAKRTVWLRDVPALEFDPATCLSSNKTLSPCTYKPLASQQDGADLQMQAARAAHVPTIDLDDMFCDSVKICTTVVGDTVTHRDSHHLTATYSRELGRTLGERLKIW
ncbi:peptidoglycan/LPS O-acetylase OafA/YrhL [Nocardioides luteus]|uniref:Acyltransferase n=1 Tax=Nocardioides luteus TaxID=1844 RepID=A0ABQ5T2I3_9ACTN|nr:acyltransferase family protein [Nocardioides luteus]MDR7310829.1 peptidoglycan/LPS O-acetylase OafA/YrhL [Nocardioides luteus]GGR40372.1 acyltransferase [Nocardioides luteus]GLJ69391.1 acyltransferase [Nocardioides luteus]